MILVSISCLAGEFDDEPMVRVKYGNVGANLEDLKESSKQRFGERISFNEKEGLARKNREEMSGQSASDQQLTFTGQKVFSGMHRLDLVKKGIVQLQKPKAFAFLQSLKNSRYEVHHDLLLRIMSGEFYDLAIGDLNIIMDESGLDVSLRYGVPSLQIGKLDIVVSLNFTVALKNDDYVEEANFRSKFLELENRPEEEKPYLNKSGLIGVYRGINFYEYFVEFQASQGFLSDARIDLIKANRSRHLEKALPSETNAENTKFLIEHYLKTQLLNENVIAEISDRFTQLTEIIETEKIRLPEEGSEEALQAPSASLRLEKL